MWVGELRFKTTVNSLAFAPNGRTLYCGDGLGYVTAWDLRARTSRDLFRRPSTAPNYRSVHWLWPTPDGRLLIQDQHRLVDALHPDAGPVLDPGSGERGYFRYLLPDGRRAAKVDPDNDSRVDWWDLETGLRVPVPGPYGEISDVYWHDLLPDGVTAWTYACPRSADYQDLSELSLWDVRTGERVGELMGPGVRRGPRDYSFIQIDADARTLALARKQTVW